MLTSDIRGANPKKLDCTFDFIKETYKNGPVIYENRNYLGNGDIITNKTHSRINNIKIRQVSDSILRNKRNKSDYQDQLRENYHKD